ncbi:hypothetical protein [Streptomyces sp. NPDC058308]|uniref:hypothetical protein n=1 Tax=Streptomyces sp. NPDC058308 TaxID=3346440 RepID=UPI0036EF93E9
MAADIYFPGQGTLAEQKYLEGVAEGEAKGKAAGKAEAILSFLALRGVPIPDTARERIKSCTDLPTLDHWLTRTATATDADDLFSDGEDREDSQEQGE